MHLEELHEYCLSRPFATEEMPFGEDIVVFKIANKIFALMWLDKEPYGFNVKCDPEKAIELREAYPDHVRPGYHMNKTHWNTIYLGALPSDFYKKQIDHSYELIFRSLPQRIRQQFKSAQ